MALNRDMLLEWAATQGFSDEVLEILRNLPLQCYRQTGWAKFYIEPVLTVTIEDSGIVRKLCDVLTDKVKQLITLQWAAENSPEFTDFVQGERWADLDKKKVTLKHLKKLKLDQEQKETFLLVVERIESK